MINGEETVKWRKLDNSAKIFPISAGKKYSTVFRYSIVLKEKIEADILINAVNKSLNKFKYFKVKLKKGVFWHYLDYNYNAPIIEKEAEYPCAYVNPSECNEYLFRISYLKNKINVDYYHALTDGNSALEFLKEIIYNYLENSHKEEFKKSKRNEEFIKYDLSAADDFLSNYDKNAKAHPNNELAYVIQGKRLPQNQIGTIHAYMNSDILKNTAKEYNASITQYLSAVLIYAIYKQMKQRREKGKKINRPIKVCIPVNLRRYFQSKTISNFFSYFSIVAHTHNDNLGSFEKILQIVKDEFEHKLTFEEINNTMSANVKLGTNPFIRYIPLPFKVLLVRTAYNIIRRYTTVTFSNVGRIGLIKEYQQFVDHALFMITPEPIEKIKVSAISCGNITAISFTTNISETGIERQFYDILTSHGIAAEVESNIPDLLFKSSKLLEKEIETPYPEKYDSKNKIFTKIEKYKEKRSIRVKNFIESVKKRFNS